MVEIVKGQVEASRQKPMVGCRQMFILILTVSTPYRDTCIMLSSLTCPFEHSWKTDFSLLAGSVSFPLCCTDEPTKEEVVICQQIEIHVHEEN